MSKATNNSPNNKSTNKSANKDSFQAFIAKIPKDISDGFSDKQIIALESAVAQAEWGNHAIDLRDSIGIFNWRYYFVFISGRDKRGNSTRRHKIMGIVKLMLLLGYLVSSTLLGILALYLVKSAYGIDLFQGYSFGVWHWFKELTCN